METAKKKKPALCQLRIEQKLYDRMRQQAIEEGLPMSAWLRCAGIAQLRRAKKKAA